MLYCCVRPASVQPQKNYNVLVRDIFGARAPPLNDPVPEATKKRMQKLAEYANNNYDKIPKISRRLSRKIHQALPKPEEWGHIRTAVTAYAVLLTNTQQDNAKYTSSFFEEELLNATNALIPELLNHEKSPIRALGADLLAAYTKVQDSADSLDKIEAFVPTICGFINQNSPGNNKNPSDTSELLSCLLFLHEHVLMCQRLRMLPKHLHIITGCVLDNLGDSSTPQPASPSNQSRLSEMPMLGGKDSQQPKHTPAEVARGILHLFSSLMCDIANTQALSSALLRYLNDRHKWHQQDLVQDVLQMLRSASPDQHFLLYTTLLEHAADRGRTVDECSIITRLACKEGLSQRTALATLSQALQQLPIIYMSATQRKGADPLLLDQLKSTILDGCNKLACKVCDVSQLCEALGGSLRNLSENSEQSMVSLECCLAAVQALHQLGEEERKLVGNRMPPSVMEPLCTILSGWPPVPRSYAYTILLTLLQYNPKAAGDDVTSALILDALWAQISLPDSLPAHFEAMCAVLQACIAAARASSLTLLVRFMISMGREVMRKGSRMAAISRARACAILELINCLVNSLASACNLPDLCRIPLENSCPAVKVKGGRLVAEAHDFDNPMYEKKAESLLGVLEGRVNIKDWAALICHEICKITALQQEFGDNLPAVLMSHFDAYMDKKAPSDKNSDCSGTGAKAVFVDKLIQGHFERSDSNMVMAHQVPGPRFADLLKDDSFTASADTYHKTTTLESVSSSLKAQQPLDLDPAMQRLLNVLQITKGGDGEDSDLQFKAIMHEIDAR